MSEVLQTARAAYARGEWDLAFDRLEAARAEGVTSAADLAALADAAWWLGRNDRSLAAFEEAYEQHLREGRVPEAAKLALDIGYLWLLRNEVAVGSGWLSRARRLLAALPECVVHGYVLCFDDINTAMANGDLAGAIALARRAQAIATRFHDQTLLALAISCEGVAVIQQGQVGAGLAVLDEAMLPVLAGAVSPEVAGTIYCKLMGVCVDLIDLLRARQWTDATQRWCEQLTSAVMFEGICRIHRVQLLEVQGDWTVAEREAQRVCVDLADMNLPVVAEAHYRIGEVRRLRDDLAAAEAAYKLAHQLGHDVQPGLALLRLAQGRGDAAAASIATALAGVPDDRFARARLLIAQVEVLIALGDLASAAVACAELEEIAAVYASPGLEAWARHSRGEVLVAQERFADALPLLRETCRRWRDLAAPYNTAKARVLLAQACAGLGDTDAAALELDAAEEVFARLGATADVRRVAELRGRPRLPGGLTEREAEVLACLAAGRSNREIAATLVISEKTVARHPSNIFTKLGLSSRTAVAAYAFEHGLASPARG